MSLSPSTLTNGRDLSSRVSALPAVVRAGAFWAAVVLPFVTLAFLASGLHSTGDFLVLGALLVANVVSLVLGHGYGQ